MDDITIPEIDVLEAKQRVENGALLIDVREQNEYDDIHIPGAQLFALSELAQSYRDLPTDKPLVMQCRSGARSAKAAEFLLQNGYSDVVNMTGGILAWAQAELPTRSAEPVDTDET